MVEFLSQSVPVTSVVVFSDTAIMQTGILFESGAWLGLLLYNFSKLM